MLSVSVFGYADRMMDIMQGYNAKTMSQAEMDSVLEGENEKVKSERFRLEYTNEVKLFRHSFFADTTCMIPKSATLFG